MVKRAIALSLALLIGVAALVPLATQYAEAGPRKSKKYRKHKHYKKYSKAWWRQYRARMRHRNAMAAKRRAMRLHQLRLAKKAEQQKAAPDAKAAKTAPIENAVAMLPSGEPAPRGWKRTQAPAGELQFQVDDGKGSQLGSASIAVVGPAMGESVDSTRSKMIGGISTTSLRRDVINRMINENGWVVNDYQKEVGGRTVYVVVAQSQGPNGRVDSRMFYFTEADGRIYNVATNTPQDTAERLAEESEKVLASLAARPRVQAAKND